MGEAGEVVVVLRTQVLDWYVRDHGTGLKVRVSGSDHIRSLCRRTCTGRRPKGTKMRTVLLGVLLCSPGWWHNSGQSEAAAGLH